MNEKATKCPKKNFGRPSENLENYYSKQHLKK